VTQGPRQSETGLSFSVDNRSGEIVRTASTLWLFAGQIASHARSEELDVAAWAFCGSFGPMLLPVYTCILINSTKNQSIVSRSRIRGEGTYWITTPWTASSPLVGAFVLCLACQHPYY